MVINLMRDPAESLLLIAAWLWLEQMGYPNIINLMQSLSNTALDVLSNEAAVALASLQSSTLDLSRLPNGGLMPATSEVMSRTFSVDVFHHQRYTTITGIKNFLTTVCARVFTDILQKICPMTARAGDLVIHGFPHPLFGDLTITPTICRPHYRHQGQNGTAGFIPTGGLWGWEPYNNATDDDKTLFLTFSRGFPVTKDEVVELFTRKYGEGSVVSVMMQENMVCGEQQTLFAKMMMRSVTVVDEVLGGNRIAKFRINGKHIWARKYERREQTVALPPPPA
ncbi:hypothetical protein LINPERPRIM_LOCUS19691 [Linum perenne]